MTETDTRAIERQIGKRRRQLLVHRFCYYVRAEPLISDFEYDLMERDLKELVAVHPDIAAAAKYADDCPTQHVGSDALGDYPRELQYLGDALLDYKARGCPVPPDDEIAAPQATVIPGTRQLGFF